MKNINKSIINNVEEKFFSMLGNISEKIADNARGTCVTYLIHEPDFPQELLQSMKEDD